MKVVIIGGAATGMGVAAKLQHEDPNASITVIQNHDYVSLGACGLPYYVGLNFVDKHNMIARDVSAFQAKGVEVLTNTTAIDIDTSKKTVMWKHTNGTTGTNAYDNLVIATGATPTIPPIPGLATAPNAYTLTSLEDGVKMVAQISQNRNVKNVAVIGAGFIGLEVMGELAHLNKNVTIIEKGSAPLMRKYDAQFSDAIIQEINEHENVQTHFNDGLKAVEVDKNGAITKIILESGTTVQTDAVIVAIGFRPNTAFLRDKGFDMLPNGALVVDVMGKTNIPFVWSVGDCATSRHIVTNEDIYSPLATVASKFARVIAANIAGGNAKFHGSLQSSMIKIFDLELARTGLTEEEALSKGYQAKAVTIHDKDQTNYVGVQSDLTLKVIYDSKANVLLGAQMMGRNKAILRIDALVALIWDHKPLDEYMEQIDFPYAPPFSRTSDIIHIALSKIIK